MRIVKTAVMFLFMFSIMLFSGCNSLYGNGNNQIIQSFLPVIPNGTLPNSSPYETPSPNQSSSPTIKPLPTPSTIPENIKTKYILNQIAIEPVIICENYYQSGDNFLTYKNSSGYCMLAKLGIFLSESAEQCCELDNIYVSENYLTPNNTNLDNEVYLALENSTAFNKSLFPQFKEYEFDYFDGDLELYFSIELKNYCFNVEGEKIEGCGGNKTLNFKYITINEDNLTVTLKNLCICSSLGDINSAGILFDLTFSFKII